MPKKPLVSGLWGPPGSFPSPRHPQNLLVPGMQQRSALSGLPFWLSPLQRAQSLSLGLDICPHTEIHKRHQMRFSFPGRHHKGIVYPYPAEQAGDMTPLPHVSLGPRAMRLSLSGCGPPGESQPAQQVSRNSTSPRKHPQAFQLLGKLLGTARKRACSP